VIRMYAFMGLIFLAACGVDGEPIQPSMNTTIGVGSDGVHGAVGTSVVSGNISVHVGTSL